MLIPKLNLDPTKRESIEHELLNLENQAINCHNWPQVHNHAPVVNFKAFHTGEYLVLHFEVANDYATATATADGAMVCNDSCVELFLSPEPECYYNFEFNVLGTLRLGFRKEGIKCPPAPAQVLQSVLRLPSETLNTLDNGKTSKFWTLTAVIPITALYNHNFRSFDGMRATANLYKCGDKTPLPHYLSWQPIATEKPSFHQPQFFGEIEFQN